MTLLDDVYDAFLAKILEDEWGGETWTEVDMKDDLKTILLGSIPHFKFPRVSLEINEEETGFNDNLNNDEIQILATYMKCEWLNRTILTWENIKPQYEERDFSQANMLDKLSNRLSEEWKKAEKLESKYYRSINNRPFDYTRLATYVG